MVTIIIVNWNGGEVFRECLKSLKKVKDVNFELIVVDNGSTDGSERFPEKLNFKNYKLIKNESNLGFAKANNQGYKFAKGKYILLLNNDTLVKPDFLSKLVGKIAENKNFGVVQPKILLMNKRSYLDSVGSFLTRTGFLQHYGYLKKDSIEYNQDMFLFSAKGACMLIKREVIKKVGLFDKDFVSYMEETDFCWRVWMAGYKITYLPSSVIYHKVGYSSKRQSQIIVNYHSFKNRMATIFKNLGFANLLTIGTTHMLIILFLSFYYLLRLQPRKALIIWKAIAWNIVNFNDLITKRRKVQRLRIKSDSDIFPVILQSFDYKGMLKHFIRSEKMFKGKHEV